MERGYQQSDSSADGCQGTGKNKLADKLLMLMQREREYLQLHRDTTVQSQHVEPGGCAALRRHSNSKHADPPGSGPITDDLAASGERRDQVGRLAAGAVDRPLPQLWTNCRQHQL